MVKLIGLLIIVALIGFGSFYLINPQEKKEEANLTSNEVPDSVKSFLTVTPISHASMIIPLGNQIIYNDPVGGANLYEGQPTPDIILVSDIHSDHFDPKTLETIAVKGSTLIVPLAVASELPDNIEANVVVLRNGESMDKDGISIEAIPMYNIPESEDARHPNGRGNGYLLESEGKRVYIAGDTSMTKEMVSLKNIDVAFIPMNSPFTMSVEEAAEAVLKFKPAVVYPYHYRTEDGYSDIEKFKDVVNLGNPEIDVELLNFYPEQK